MLEGSAVGNGMAEKEDCTVVVGKGVLGPEHLVECLARSSALM